MLSSIMAKVAERRESGDMEMYKRSLNRAKNYVTSQVKTIEANVKKVDELRQLAANPKVFKRGGFASFDAPVDRVENFDPIYAKNLFDTYVRLLRPSEQEKRDILQPLLDEPGSELSKYVKEGTSEIDFEKVRKAIAKRDNKEPLERFDAYVMALADRINRQANEEEDRLIDSQRALGLAIGMDLDFDPEQPDRDAAGRVISRKTGS